MRFMRFIIWNTFFTLVADDVDDVTQESCPPRPRRHSAPPTLTYAEPERAVFQSKQHKHRRRRKEARARRTKDAADSAAADELVLMESIKQAEEERLLLGEHTNEPDDDDGKPRRRKVRRERVKRKSGVRLRFRFRAPDEERPPDAIFVLKESYGEIGFTHDPSLCTTALRRLLIDINDRDWGDDYEVTTMEGQHVAIDSTLGEQNVMPGARLRLSRSADSDPCRQS